MKKLLLPFIMLFLITGLIAQQQYGPEFFPSQLQTFDGNDLSEYKQLHGDWEVSENPNTARQELHWTRGTQDNLGYMWAGYLIAWEAASFENYEVSAKVTSTWSNRFGIIYNYQDSTNWQAAYFNPKDSIARVYEQVNANINLSNEEEAKALKKVENVTIDTETNIFYLKVRNHEGLTSFWINDTLIFDDIPTSDTAFNYGMVGFMGMSNNEIWFDSLVVKSTFRDVSLSDLTASSGEMTPAFDSEVYEYDLLVPFGESSVDITATASDATATVTGDGQITTFPSTVEIVVESEDGTVSQTYTINVTQSTSVNSSALAAAQVYPNPAGNYLQVKARQGSYVKLINVTGVTVYEGIQTESELRIDMSDMNSGLYFVGIEDNGTSRVLKVVKQ